MLNWLREQMNSGELFGYFLQALPVSLLAGITYLVIRLMKDREKKNWLDTIVRTLFVSYLTGLISLVVLPNNFWLNVLDGLMFGSWEEMGPVFSFGYFNLVPSIVKVMAGELTLGSWVRTMLVMNVLMFVPLGFFLAYLTDKVSRKNIVYVSVLVPLLFETVQLMFGRSFDTDDLICNFIGLIIGIMIGLALKAFCQKARETS